MANKLPSKLDLGCGQNKQEGFYGVDIAGDQADLKHNLFLTPWPFKTSTAEVIFCSHFIEHIPHDIGYKDELGANIDGWWVFFNELYRVCKNDAQVMIAHPYVRSDRAFWDPTHTRYIHEMTWYYLSKEWRISQGLDHYHTDCDFVVSGSGIQGIGIPPEISTRSQEFQTFGRTHYWNMIPDLNIELKVVK